MSRTYLLHGPQIPDHCQFIVYLAIGLTSSFTSKKNAWALSHGFKLEQFFSCSCVILNEWLKSHSVLFISVECFFPAK